jgi:hypothetical protein
MRLEARRGEPPTELGEHRGEVDQLAHGLLDGRGDRFPDRGAWGLGGHDQPE